MRFTVHFDTYRRHPPAKQITSNKSVSEVHTSQATLHGVLYV